MTDQVILFLPSSTATANAGNYGKTGLIGGFIAVALSLNMGVSTSAASTAGIGATPTIPASTTAPESSYASTVRKRRAGDRAGLNRSVDSTSDNHISIVSSASDHMSTLLQRVDSFSILAIGWDGYEGDAPDRATIDNAISFLSSLPSSFINNLSEYSLTPTGYGTINVEWTSHDSDFVSVEIGHSAIAYFFEVKGEKGESSENIVFGSENYTGGIYSALNSLYTSTQA